MTLKGSMSGKKNTKEIIEKAILKYLGVLGYAKSGAIFVKKEKNLILAVNRKMLDEVKSALALSNISVKKVSGTIKGLS